VGYPKENIMASFRFTLFGVMVVAGLAMAQVTIQSNTITPSTPSSGPTLAGNGESYNQGTGSATVSQTIKLTIPPRAALHLTETRWELDLDQPPMGNTSTLKGCFLIPKTYTGTGETAFRNALAREWKGVDNYPAIRDLNGDNKISDDEKGTLWCMNKKIIQKFCNGGGACQLDVKVFGTNSSFGRFFILDRAVRSVPACQGRSSTDNRVAEVTTVGMVTSSSPYGGNPSQPVEVFCTGGATNGWLDDEFFEAFWFDGSERPGTTELTLTYTLYNF
jgi:hypothetical protein